VKYAYILIKLPWWGFLIQIWNVKNWC